MSNTEHDSTTESTNNAGIAGVALKDNYNPAPPRVVKDSVPVKPQDNYNPILPIDAASAEGPGAEAPVTLKDNYNPAPPRVVKDSVPAEAPVKLMDNYNPAPPKP